MRYAYPCNIVRDEEEKKATGREAYNVTFPDIYGANACGWSWEEALEVAEVCLEASLGGYVRFHEDIPVPSPVEEGQILVAVPPIIAAKLALHTAMREQGITKVELAARLGIYESAVRRIVDPRHRSHIGQVEKALRAVGRSLIVEDTATALSVGQFS